MDQNQLKHLYAIHSRKRYRVATCEFFFFNLFGTTFWKRKYGTYPTTALRYRNSIDQNSTKTINLSLLPQQPYSSDRASSDCHLFWSKANGLAGIHLDSFEEMQNWLDKSFRSKDTPFYFRSIHVLAKSWQSV